MLKKIHIQNFKSIVDLEIELGRFNVFIGENGCGKTTILEALGMVSAAQENQLEIGDLIKRGLRPASPNLTFSSFNGKRKKEEVQIVSTFENEGEETVLETLLEQTGDDNDTWYKSEMSDFYLGHQVLEEFQKRLKKFENVFRKNYEELVLLELHHKYISKELTNYLIYDIDTPSLRGLNNRSYTQPLGIFGERLDILMASFKEEELNMLKKHSHFIHWLDDVVIDAQNELKFHGHKLGMSSSRLFFTDKFMQKKNNLLSAETANEGALHTLFYLALFISKRSPGLFAIDNIEKALNPQLCRSLTKELALLAKETDKQCLITTHNPAVLDGLNLHDDEQRLFVVSRNNEGHTTVNRIEMKPKSKNSKEKYKLSEMWMRGLIGGLPINF